MAESMNKGGGLILVVTGTDSKGVLRVAVDSRNPMGLPLSLEKGDVPVETRIRVAVGQVPDLPAELDVRAIRILDLMDSAIDMPDGHKATLVLVRIEDLHWRAPGNWQTFPAILRAMAPGKNRVSWMKAMQILAGGKEQDCDALEVDEEVLARLRSLAEKEPSTDS